MQTCYAHGLNQKQKRKEDKLARDNYSYKKYQKELANKKKKEEKRQSKLDKKNMQAKADPEKASNGDVTIIQPVK